MIKVIITDDHRIIRDGISALLSDEPNIEVVADIGTGKELLDVLPDLNPDVVLMDINMPEMDGIEATKAISSNYTSIKVIGLSALDNQENIRKLLDAGAVGYVLKSSGKEELINAIKIVANGYKYVSPEIALKLLEKNVPLKSEEGKENGRESSQISKRELEVLKLIADGYTNSEIADKLFTSKRTIESHRRNLIEKTHTKNTAELIKYSLSKGILT